MYEQVFDPVADSLALTSGGGFAGAHVLFAALPLAVVDGPVNPNPSD